MLEPGLAVPYHVLAPTIAQVGTASGRRDIVARNGWFVLLLTGISRAGFAGVQPGQGHRAPHSDRLGVWCSVVTVLLFSLILFLVSEVGWDKGVSSGGLELDSHSTLPPQPLGSLRQFLDLLLYAAPWCPGSPSSPCPMTAITPNLGSPICYGLGQ